MNSFISKLIFRLRKPRVVVITGSNHAFVAETVFQILSKFLEVKRILQFDFIPRTGEILIWENQSERYKDLEFLVKNSKLPILIVSDDTENKKISRLTKALPPNSHLIISANNEILKEIKDLSDFKVSTFGFEETADFQVSDLRLNHMTNFKLNYQGNIIPVWLDYVANENQISNALVVMAVGTVLNLNLVNISQALKSYKDFSEIDKNQIS